MFKDTVVALFDDSANLFDDWLAVGYTVVCVDLMPLDLRIPREGVVHLVADLRLPLKVSDLGVDPALVAFVSAHPPCGNLAISGSRWFKGKGLRALAESVTMFATAAEFCEEVGAPYMIENPVSTISTYWRKPDYWYSPYMYSGYDKRDYYTKKTCLWVGGGFKMPPPFFDEERFARGMEQRKAVLTVHGKGASREEVQALQPDYPDARIHNSGGALKAYFRSITPKGFGRATYLSNCELAQIV